MEEDAHRKGTPVRRQRTAAEQQIADLLGTARSALGMSVAFLSRLDGTTQHLEVVEAAAPARVLVHVSSPTALVGTTNRAL